MQIAEEAQQRLDVARDRRLFHQRPTPEEGEALSSIRAEVDDLLLEHVGLQLGRQRVTQRGGVGAARIVLAKLDEVVGQVFIALLHLFLLLHLDRANVVREVDPHQLGDGHVDEAAATCSRSSHAGPVRVDVCAGRPARALEQSRPNAIRPLL